MQKTSGGGGEWTALRERITKYLEVGGLWNPEHMSHPTVRDLLIDCREALDKLPVSRGSQCMNSSEYLLKSDVLTNLAEVRLDEARWWDELLVQIINGDTSRFKLAFDRVEMLAQAAEGK